MSTPVSLAGRMAKNRQLKLLAAQSRHLKNRFAAIFGGAQVRTSRINRRHFESHVDYPLSAFCTLHLASATAESSTESVERVYGAALSLLNSAMDLHHLLQVVDSDVFLELNATLSCMDARLVVHVLRATDDVMGSAASTARFMTTVTAELPLTDGEAVEFWGSRATNDFTSDVAICRSSGSCPRDAIKVGFALALAELDEYAVRELRSREAEAGRFLQSVQNNAERRDWGSAFLSAFLCNLFGGCNEVGEAWRLSSHTESVPAPPPPLLFARDGCNSLSLSTTDDAGNETRTVMPLFPSSASGFQRVVLRNDSGAVQLAYGSALQWPGVSLVSSTLMQLCAVMHSSVSTSDIHMRELTGPEFLQETFTFPSVQTFINAHGTLPGVVSRSVERGLFLLNNLVALHLAVSTERNQTDGRSDTPVIQLVFTPSGAMQDVCVRLEVVGESGNVEKLEAHRAVVGVAMQLAQKPILRKRTKWDDGVGGVSGGRGEQQQRSLVDLWSLLGKVWHMLAVTAAATRGGRSYRDLFLWSPPDFGFTEEQQLRQHTQMLSYIGQLFAADAEVLEGTSPSGTLPSRLALSSASLGVQALPLFHLFGTFQETCQRFFALHRSSSRNPAVMAGGEDAPDPQRAVEDATRNQQMEQSSYYCHDLLLMIQEMRLELQLSQRSFPTLEFFQKAVHDVPKRVQELAVGCYGDVPVYTRVVAHWGPGLRVEVENNLKDLMEVGVHGGLKMQKQDHHEGPLRLLIRVICGMYKQVFPHRMGFPLIALNSPTTRSAIDFLLYVWFMAPPQVRCFEIGTRAARLAAVANAASQKRLDLAEETLLHGVDDYIIRAMLFYDFCGQRVLFAETHALTVREAVRRVNELAVSLNIPASDCFPSRPKSSRTSRSHASLVVNADSEVSVLLRALVAKTHSKPRLFFVRTNDSTSSFVEGTIEVHIPLRKFRYSAAVTQERGVILALALACREALKHSSVAEDIAAITATLQFAESAAPLLPRDGFPHFTARFYTPANLLGEVLQGVARNYHCVYTVDAHTREVVCQLYVATLAGYENTVDHAVPFPLGVGRGRSKRSAWAAAAAQALQSNFPDIIQQVDRHKALCGVLHRPDDLSRLNCRDGFVVTVIANAAPEKGGGASGGYQCSVTPRHEVGENVPSLLVHHADRAVDAYLGAADALLYLLRQRSKEGDGDDGAFSLWDPTTNYTKSVWHACCGALSVAFGGKVVLRFEGGREDPAVQESLLPMAVRLLVRTWTPSDNRITETPITLLHKRRIMDYSGLTTHPDEDCRPSAEQLLFASTRLLAEATTKYTDERTRRELWRLLMLLQRLRNDEESCPRLNVKRKMEFCVELTLGCQCRVVTSHVADGKVTAQLGVWFTGQKRGARIAIVLSVCTADTTEKALWGLHSKVQGLINPLWATAMQSCDKR